MQTLDRHMQHARAPQRPPPRLSRLSHTIPRRGRRVVAAPQAEPQSRPSNPDLTHLQNELLKEIEARRASQAALLEKLNKLSVNGAASASSAPVSVFDALTAAPQRAAPTRPPPEAPPHLEPDTPVAPPITPAAAATPATPAPVAPAKVEPPPPLAGPNVMKVVMVGAECAPWSKTGGLGDVMSALPKALARRGHRTMVISPRYANYDDAWDTSARIKVTMFGQQHEIGYFHAFRDGVDYVFVDHPAFNTRGNDLYGGSRMDLMFRCALLSKAALEAVWHVPCGGVPYGDDNLCFVANDWHTALVPVFLQAHYRDYGKMTYARCVFVIHNMAHQGRGPFPDVHNLELSDGYKGKFWLDDPVGGEHMNIMKAGLHTAHRLIAVSHGYAWECQTQEGGWGLHQILCDRRDVLRGIVNGIDCKEWNPAEDEFLTSDGYQHYTADTIEKGKAACKAALQRELGLPEDPSAPLLGFIGRLDYQKGVDLIRDNCDWLVGQKAQLVLLGSGRKDLEDALRDMEGRCKQQVRGWVGFSVKMAHRITAGCDILLMPSRFEPCGLNQLYAMAYGTVPVVHAVGGLRDTVKQYDPFNNAGTGWTFDRAEGHKLREAMGHAITTFRQHRASFTALQQRGMRQDLSWDHAAEQYEQVLVAAKYQW